MVYLGGKRFWNLAIVNFVIYVFELLCQISLNFKDFKKVTMKILRHHDEHTLMNQYLYSSKSCLVESASEFLPMPPSPRVDK